MSTQHKRSISSPSGQAIDWSKEIVNLAAERRISLRELAADLGFSHVYVGKVVRGEQPAGALLKMRVWSRTTYDHTREELLELLLPDDIAEEYHTLDVERGAARARDAAERDARRRAEAREKRRKASTVVPVKAAKARKA